jgi:hypothetical protein
MRVVNTLEDRYPQGTGEITMTTQQNKSEVGRLLEQIDASYEAAYAALYGLAAGKARHDFIQVKLEVIEPRYEQFVGQMSNREWYQPR